MLTKQGIDLSENFNNRGFSIIEVIFALSIFAIGILAVLSLSISAVNTNASARRVTDATALVEDRLEKLAAMPYEDIQNGEETEGAYKITWVVIEDDMLARTKSITVTVNCPNRWKETNVSIRHLISNNG